MSLGIFSNGRISSGICEVRTAAEDEPLLLNRASLHVPETLPVRKIKSTLYNSRKESLSSSREERSFPQDTLRYTQLENGSHEHHLPTLSSRNSNSRMMSYGTITGLDPDLNPPFETIWSTSSSWLRKFWTSDLEDDQLLSAKYSYLGDLLDNSSSDIKICMVQEKNRRVEDNTNNNQNLPGKIFVVKIFVHSQQKSVKMYQREVTAEFCIAHILQHSNIVRVLELLHNENGDLCQVMEFCDSGSLLNLLERGGKLAHDEADCFFKQLLHAVQYIHSVGVSHRNLKPENILLTSQGTLKITDFHCAECFKMPWAEQPERNPDLTQHQSLKGTIPFMAPEQFTKTICYPAVGDIWAVGIIYFAMRFVRLPWKSATDKDLLYRNYTRDLENGRGNEYIELISGDRRSVLYSILEPNPQKRCTATQVLESDWIRDVKPCAAAMASSEV